MVYVFPEPVCPYANTHTLDLLKKACTIGLTASLYIFRLSSYFLVVHLLVECVVEVEVVLLSVFCHVHLEPTLITYFSSRTVT